MIVKVSEKSSIELRNPELFCLWNPKSRFLEPGIQLKESEIPLKLKSEFQVPLSRNLESTAWSPNPRFLQITLYGAIEQFSYDLEMETREQNRNNKRTETERFDWFNERIQTRVTFALLSGRSGEKTSRPRTFQKSTDTSL